MKHSLLKEKLPYFDLKYVFNYFRIPIKHSNHEYEMYLARNPMTSLHRIISTAKGSLDNTDETTDGTMERLVKEAIGRIKAKYRPVTT